MLLPGASTSRRQHPYPSGGVGDRAGHCLHLTHQVRRHGGWTHRQKREHCILCTLAFYIFISLFINFMSLLIRHIDDVEVNLGICLSNYF